MKQLLLILLIACPAIAADKPIFRSLPSRTDRANQGDYSSAPLGRPQLLQCGRTPEGPRMIWADNSTDEVGFEIEKRFETGPWVEAGTVDKNATYFVDKTNPKEAVAYRVRAFRERTKSERKLFKKDKLEFGPWSNELSLSPDGPIITP